MKSIKYLEAMCVLTSVRYSRGMDPYLEKDDARTVYKDLKFFGYRWSSKYKYWHTESYSPDRKPPK